MVIILRIQRLKNCTGFAQDSLTEASDHVKRIQLIFAILWSYQDAKRKEEEIVLPLWILSNEAKRWFRRFSPL